MKAKRNAPAPRGGRIQQTATSRSERPVHCGSAFMHPTLLSLRERRHWTFLLYPQRGKMQGCLNSVLLTRRHRGRD